MKRKKGKDFSRLQASKSQNTKQNIFILIFKYIIIFLTILSLALLAINITLENTIKNKEISLIEHKKIALCTIAKQENKYINEFVNYYHTLGVSKVFLYDNNDPDDEIYENNLKKELSQNIVEIIDFRGKNMVQNIAYSDCYNKHSLEYDWIIITDADEFYFLQNGNFDSFLDENIFKDCDSITLNLVTMGDCNLTHYDSRPILERFNNAKEDRTTSIKSMYRGGRKNVRLSAHYSLNNKFSKICNPNGQKAILNDFISDNGSFKRGYIRHYMYKTAEELYNKLLREWPDKVKHSSSSIQLTNTRIKQFFELNEITREKLDILKPLLKSSEISEELEKKLKEKNEKI